MTSAPMHPRFIAHPGSASGHCCFEATVLDTVQRQSGGVGTDGKPASDGPGWVCECFDEATAQAIADALNAREEMGDAGR